LACAAALLLVSAPALAAVERIELSAPIFPDVEILYAHEGASFPASPDAEAQLVADAALSFDQLVTECAQRTDPKSGAPYSLADGDTLTPAQLTSNYDTVARCAYEQFTAKPYWIPQLVDDVDVCAATLGADWHLPTEADLASFGADDYAFFGATLTGAADGTSFWGSFYFSLTVFVRAADGSLQKADLGPDVTMRVQDLGLSAAQRKQHYEGGAALRCLRRTSL
jgi:hypothetical protein